MNQTPTPAPWRSMAVRYTKNSKSPFKNPVNNFNKILDGITQNSPLVPCFGRQKWTFARTNPADRPRVDAVLEKLVVKLLQENPTLGSKRIVGALANLGFKVSDSTVDNIRLRNGHRDLCVQWLPQPDQRLFHGQRSVLNQ